MADSSGLFGLMGNDSGINAANILRSRYRQPIAQAAMENADTGSIRATPPTPFESWLNESGQRLMNPTDTIAQGVQNFTQQDPVDMGMSLLNGGMGGALGATVWHGSPHKFDKFDFSKIGTGEGAQAYGHGGYLADARQVGEGYRDRLATNYLKGDGNTVATGDVWTNARDAAKSVLNLHPDNAGEVANHVQQWIDSGKKAETYLRYNAVSPQLAPAYQAVVEQFKGIKPNPGYLYKIDLPDEHIAKMLDWDKPLSEQSPEVQSALEKLMPKGAVSPHNLDMGGGKILDNRMGQADPTQVQPWILHSGNAKFGLTQKDVDRMVAEHGAGTTGENAYTRITGSLGGQTNASDALQQAGIPGIKYLDATSRPQPSIVSRRLSALYDKHQGNAEAAVNEMMRSVYNTPAQKESIRLEFMKQLETPKTSNYVVFPGNEDMLTILERNNQPLVNALRSK